MGCGDTYNVPLLKLLKNYDSQWAVALKKPFKCKKKNIYIYYKVFFHNLSEENIIEEKKLMLYNLKYNFLFFFHFLFKNKL